MLSQRQISCRSSLPSAPQPPARAASWHHLPPHRWSQRHVRFSFGRRPGFCCSLEGEARLPLPAPVVFALLTHPDNSTILRSLDRCTQLRTVSADGGSGLSVLEVEHESTISFLGFRSRVATPLLVEQDGAGLVMRYRLAPRGEACGHLDALEGCWSVVPDGPSSSLLRVEQAVQPRGLPPLVGKAVRGFVAGQLRATFEDFFAESQCINSGRPTLPLGPGLSPGLSAAGSRSSEGSGAAHSGSLEGSGAAGQGEPSDMPRFPSQDEAEGSPQDATPALSSSSSGGSSASGEASPPPSPFAAFCHSPFGPEPAVPAQLSGHGNSGSTAPAGARIAATTGAGPVSHPLSLSSLLSGSSSLGYAERPLASCSPGNSRAADPGPPAVMATSRGALGAWLTGWCSWLLEGCESLGAAGSEPPHSESRRDSWAAAPAMPVPRCL